MKNRLKVNGFIIFLAALSLFLFPAVFLRPVGHTPGNKFAEIFGIVFILLGQILRASGRGYKSENSASGHALIQGGPYALVRNPMYLGILLIGLGIVLILFNWWVAVVFLSIFIWRYSLLIFKEEKKLFAIFAAAYQDYKQKIPRLLPSLYAVFQKDMAEYLPLKPLWLKKETGSIVAVLLFVLLLEGARYVKGEGINAYFKELWVFFTVIILFILLIIYLIRRTNKPQKYASDKSKNTL